MKVLKIEKKPYKCPDCDERFKDKRNIPRHTKLKHSETVHLMLQCHHCKKAYSTKGNHDAHFDKVHLAAHLLYVEPGMVKPEGM